MKHNGYGLIYKHKDVCRGAVIERTESEQKGREEKTKMESHRGHDLVVSVCRRAAGKDGRSWLFHLLLASPPPPTSNKLSVTLPITQFTYIKFYRYCFLSFGFENC